MMLFLLSRLMIWIICSICFSVSLFRLSSRVMLVGALICRWLCSWLWCVGSTSALVTMLSMWVSACGTWSLGGFLSIWVWRVLVCGVSLPRRTWRCCEFLVGGGVGGFGCWCYGLVGWVVMFGLLGGGCEWLWCY